MADWLLFVDESGEFENPGDQVCVGGVLLQQDDAERVGQVLRRALDQIYPHVPYPPHASHLNWASAHLAAWWRWPTESVFSAKLKAAEAHLERARHGCPDNTSVDNLRNRVARRLKLNKEDYQACDRWLSTRAPAAFALLQDIRQECTRRMVRMLDHTSSRLRSDREFVLVAVTERADPFAVSARERYLELLQVLFRKVFLLLRGRPKSAERHDIDLRVASRRVMDARRELELRDLEQCIGQATPFPLYPPPAESPCTQVRWAPHIEEKYDGTVHPGVVLADFATNRIRWELSEKHTSWKEMRQGLRQHVGLPADIPPAVDKSERRPSIVAAGPPWSLITEAFARSREHPPGARLDEAAAGGVAPRWSRGCVFAWGAVAARLRP